MKKLINLKICKTSGEWWNFQERCPLGPTPQTIQKQKRQRKNSRKPWVLNFTQKRQRYKFVENLGIYVAFGNVMVCTKGLCFDLKLRGKAIIVFAAQKKEYSCCNITYCYIVQFFFRLYNKKIVVIFQRKVIEWSDHKLYK